MSKSLNDRVKDYLKKHSDEINNKGFYGKVAEIFNIHPERVRALCRRSGLKQSSSKRASFSKSTFKENIASGTADVEFITKKRIKTLDDLLAACEVDGSQWTVISYEVNKWEVGRKDKFVDWNIEKGVTQKGTVKDSGKIHVEPLFQVKAKLARRKLGNDLGLQKEAILAELKKYSPIVKVRNYGSKTGEFLLEIALPDVHLGSLSWAEESGENYDLKIAERRFKKAIVELLARVNVSSIKRILLPIGNDLVNIDNKNNTTANGTLVDTDVRFIKMIKAAKALLIQTIDELSQIAPVDVVVVPGNHDFTASFFLGEILDAFYAANANVIIYNSPRPRKYYQWGTVGIQLTHGNEESHNNLGLIFASEEPHIWAATKHRFCQLGHEHKNKKINYISVDEFPGFQIQILPSLSTVNAWAHKRGYSSLKQGKAFMFSKTEGLIAELTTTAADE